MESAQAEDSPAGGERRKQLQCFSQPPWARKGPEGQKPADTISLSLKVRIIHQETNFDPWKTPRTNY